MTTITVGNGEQYSTIAAAVAASSSGDTINVDAGTYTNDFLNISHSLTLQAVGGTVNLVATAQPANGKGIIDEGGPGVNVTINGFDISGATVRDANGAGIRYEGGSLTLNNDTIHNNQNGILAAADPNGSISIANSTFANNGIGDGYTHNIYVGAIGSLSVRNSTSTGAQVGHDIKSRAASTTIIGNTITDGSTGTASYEIDLTNGGVGDIEGNYIQKGANAQNPIAITFGEEGNPYANSSLKVTGNTIVSDYTAHYTTAVVNDTGATATVSGNNLYGWNTVVSGPANAGNNTVLTSEPAQNSVAQNSVAQNGPAPSSTTSSAGSSAASIVPASSADASSTVGGAPMTAVDGTAMAASDGTTTPATTSTAPPNAGSNATISPGTVDTSSTAPSFLTDAAGSASQQSSAVNSEPASAPDTTNQVLADYTAAAVSPAPTSTAPDWTNGSDQMSAADGSQYWGSYDHSGRGGAWSMMGIEHYRATTGTTA